MIPPGHDLLRLQEHDQPDDGRGDASQEFAGSKAKGAARITLSTPRGTSGTRRRRGRGSGALGGSGGRKRASSGLGAGRAANWERAGTVDLLLNLGRELPAHSGQLELGGEGQSGELRLLGVLEGERLEPDEAEWVGKSRQTASHQKLWQDPRHVLFLGVGSDGGVRSELELADGGNIGRGREQLEGGLLLRVSDVNGDLGGTEVLQGWSRVVGIFNPCDSLFLTGRP